MWWATAAKFHLNSLFTSASKAIVKCFCNIQNLTSELVFSHPYQRNQMLHFNRLWYLAVIALVVSIKTLSNVSLSSTSLPALLAKVLCAWKNHTIINNTYQIFYKWGGYKSTFLGSLWCHPKPSIFKFILHNKHIAFAKTAQVRNVDIQDAKSNQFHGHITNDN